MEKLSVTITRKQAETQDNSLVHRPSEQLTTSPQSSQPSPKWLGLVLQIAQDKRHDIAAPTLRFWREKLKNFRDETVCEALLAGKWPYFPSVDQVIGEIERLQERSRQENANRDWLAYRQRQAQAEREGRMATDEDYAEMRAALRKVFGDPTAKQTGKS
jgi:hypothetical protein